MGGIFKIQLNSNFFFFMDKKSVSYSCTDMEKMMNKAIVNIEKYH